MKKKEEKKSWFFGISTGVILTLFGFFVNNYKSEHSLLIDMGKSISFELSTAFDLNVENNGKNVENNILVIIEDFYSKYNVEENLKGSFVHSKRNVNIIKDERGYVLNIGVLRSGESISLSVFLKGVSFSSYDEDELVVISDKTRGSNSYWIFIREVLYPLGFGVFVFLMAIILISLIYDLFFSNNKKQRDYHLNKADEYQEQINAKSKNNSDHNTN